MIKKFLFIFILLSVSYSLELQQKRNLKEIYKICRQYKANDGFTFENTCAAIALTETSAGKQLIGDQGRYPEILVNSSLGIMQVRIKTALVVLRKFDKLRKRYQFLYHKDIDAIDKYLPILINMRYYRYKIKTARSYLTRKKRYKLYLKEKNKFKKYRAVYFKDLQLAEILLADMKFNVTIAVHYLILNYEEAKRRGMWNPWLKAISKYNGGWYNKQYIKRVMRNMRIVKKYKNYLTKD